MSWLRPGQPGEARLEALRRQGLLEEVDLAFALSLGERARRLGSVAEPEALALALALLSRSTGERQVCLPLASLVIQATEALALTEALPGAPPAEGEPYWRELLEHSGLLSCPGSEGLLELDPAGRLYTRRNRRLEQRLARALLPLCRPPRPLPPLAPDTVLRAALAHAFPEPGRQRAAAALALESRLLLLTGGPGTGKTTTMVRILGLMARFLEARTLPERGLVTVLAAPTGKAAARMQQALSALGDPGLAGLPALVTLHRLLGLRPDSERAAHDAAHKLELDLLVVDEASMVDLALMTRLLEALPDHARLLLLGDRDQLASVEAGSVLADLCPDTDALPPALVERLETLCGPTPPLPRLCEPAELPTAGCRLHLDHSRRFTPESPIGRATAALRQGDGPGLLAIFAEAPDGTLERRDPPAAGELEALLADFLPGLDRLPANPAALLDYWEQRQILCALNEGPLGMHALNRRITHTLARGRSLEGALPGMPLMILGNDAGRGLFNGDTGVFVEGPHGPEAVFRQGFGLRRLPASLLPPWQPAFAITVHKSQGSEYDQVLVLLPPGARRLLGRELLYTALSRARRRLILCSTPATLLTATATSLHRPGGLRDALGAGR